MGAHHLVLRRLGGVLVLSESRERHGEGSFGGGEEGKSSAGEGSEHTREWVRVKREEGLKSRKSSRRARTQRHRFGSYAPVLPPLSSPSYLAGISSAIVLADLAWRQKFPSLSLEFPTTMLLTPDHLNSLTICRPLSISHPPPSLLEESEPRRERIQSVVDSSAWQRARARKRERLSEKEERDASDFVKGKRRERARMKKVCS